MKAAGTLDAKTQEVLNLVLRAAELDQMYPKKEAGIYCSYRNFAKILRLRIAALI